MRLSAEEVDADLIFGALPIGRVSKIENVVLANQQATGEVRVASEFSFCELSWVDVAKTVMSRILTHSTSLFTEMG